MSKDGFEGIAHGVQLAHIWVNELDERLGWNNKARTFRLLRAALHALRDFLPLEEAVQLAAQFPSVLRGIYYDQWQPSRVPVEARAKKDFLNRLSHEFANDPIQNREAAAAAFFAFLSARISVGEIEDVKQSLKADLRELWQQRAKARVLGDAPAEKILR